jgi:uncharacterized phage protein (TIGR02218 family)
MRDIPAALLEHLRSDLPSTAICWVVEKANGDTIRGTDHDRNIPISNTGSPSLGLEGVYLARANISGSTTRSSADMAVDNMDVAGATDSGVGGAIDVSVAEIEAGLLDRAPVTVFLVNWRRPDDGLLVIKRGWLGELTRDSDHAYKVEVRGLSQALSQNIGQTYAERCNVVELGDHRCRFNVSAVSRVATVTAVTSRKAFTASLAPATDPPTATYFYGGRATFSSGDNATFAREVKRAVVTAGTVVLEFWEEWPADIEIGDAATITPGCDRLMATCRDVFANLDNFRGYGVFMPGRAALIRGPT